MIDTTKKYLILRSAPRRFEGRNSHRTLWYLTPREKCRFFVQIACDTLGLQQVSLANFPEFMAEEPLTMDKAIERAHKMGYETISYQSLSFWLRRINKFEEVQLKVKEEKAKAKIEKPVGNQHHRHQRRFTSPTRRRGGTKWRSQ